MRTFVSLFVAQIILSSGLQASQTIDGDSAKLHKGKVKISLKQRQDFPENVKISIIAPPNKQTIPSSETTIQIKTEGFSVGSYTEAYQGGTSKDDLKLPQAIKFVIDNSLAYSISSDDLDPTEESGRYDESNFEYTLASPLAEGNHTIAAYMTRSNGESLKSEQSLSVHSFAVGSQGEFTEHKAPFLIYNEPVDHSQFVRKEGDKILVDFQIGNYSSYKDNGYKIKLVLDGKASATLTHWQPYLLHGVDVGEHSLSLQLIDQEGKAVPATDGFNTFVQGNFKVLSSETTP
jgi:hypothetical protein